MSIRIPSGPYRASWNSIKQYEVPEWYLDAKFGIFIHWGAYCVPAFGSEWYPREMYREGTREYEHHLATYGPQKQFGYKDFIPKLTAERFDADQWAALFRESGAKLVVPVAEHHDGFAMYDCALSDWNATKMGPKRDIIGELARAVRRRKLVFGLSSHRAEHWWFFNGGMAFDSDVKDPANEALYGPAGPDKTQPDAAFLEDWLARTCELVDKYHPQLVWFDWWIEEPAFRKPMAKFVAYYYNRAARWGKGVAVNVKNQFMASHGTVFDIERGQLAGIRPFFWQNDTSVSRNSWGYIEGQDYKSVTSIVCDLVDVVSKNGALLLNIGPKADGTIPEPEVAMLKQIGAWLKLNGEAIYATRPWHVHGEGPTAVPEGSFTDTKRQEFTAQDIRFTTRGDALYAIALNWPEDGKIVVKSLARRKKLGQRAIGKVELLGSRSKLEWEHAHDGLRVALPTRRPCEHAYVLRVRWA